MDAVRPEAQAAPYWRSTGGKLLLKRCKACGELHHYPRPHCPFCFSAETEWVEAAGQGTIYSYSVTRRGAEPYAIAFVTLAEGPTLLTNIVDTPLDTIAIGQPVDVVFRDVDGVAVPMFRRVPPG
ncbi:Zn-ribbon domain-containing OB-fold protein [Chelatococcus reniformis]|uniref:DNA-binding protein n=1 Tax=Chelatococcus reniformis TaxID=1494448 RepID=A0A916XKT3_9HYPH|nr:Zn-ribbon domain-containing OB-fold protein [Chelatococcus reniformis]GGC78152.1 DNA-binding protein [Chelatococcus reniformis]